MVFTHRREDFSAEVLFSFNTLSELNSQTPLLNFGAFGTSVPTLLAYLSAMNLRELSCHVPISDSVYESICKRTLRIQLISKWGIESSSDSEI